VVVQVVVHVFGFSFGLSEQGRLCGFGVCGGLFSGSGHRLGSTFYLSSDSPEPALSDGVLRLAVAATELRRTRSDG
jgi:hypothetical protein